VSVISALGAVMADVDVQAVALQATQEGNTWRIDWAIGLKVHPMQGSFDVAVQIRHLRNGQLVSVLESRSGSVTQGTPSCGVCQNPSTCGNSCLLFWSTIPLYGTCTDPDLCTQPSGATGVFCWCAGQYIGTHPNVVLQLNDVVEISAWPASGVNDVNTTNNVRSITIAAQ
jgi:hypothetical protein